MEELVYHIPAMLSEVLEGLHIDADRQQVFVDATFGGGGHSRGIISRMGKDSHLFSIDQDIDAYANRIEDERFTFVRSNFRYVANFMDYMMMPISFIIRRFNSSKRL